MKITVMCKGVASGAHAIRRGMAYFGMRRYNLAIIDFIAALKAYPDDTDVLRKRG